MAVKMKATVLVLEPIAPGDAPPGSVYLDQTAGNSLSTKSTGGAEEPIGAVPTSSNIFFKQMEAADAIAINRPVAKLSNGKIVQADSDGEQNIIGYALAAASADGDLINVLTLGANLANAVTGLGFAPGEEIFLDESGGYTNDPDTFSGNDDSIIKVGIADCAAGVASATATDLICFAEVIARP